MGLRSLAYSKVKNPIYYTPSIISGTVRWISSVHSCSDWAASWVDQENGAIEAGHLRWPCF